MTFNLHHHRRSSAIVACAFIAAFGCNRPTEMGRYANLGNAEKIRTALVGDAAASGEGEAAATGTGWATIRGRFIYEADATIPEMPPYPVNKDQATCAPGGQAPAQQTLVVDSGNRGIANIAIYPRKVSRVHEQAGPRSEPFVFDQKECVFLSH